MTTYTKICGITDVSAAAVAIDNGVNALGFVFYELSARNVSVESAAAIIRQLPPFVCTVGLFVNATAAFVQQVIEVAAIDLLQFHGDEDAAFCEQFAKPYIKAVRVKTASDITSATTQYASARGLLLDSFVQGVPGGTGISFDWSLIPESVELPLIIAGGLDASNVGQVIAQCAPFAVDVSGGVEQSKGVKDATKMRQFLSAVKRADGADVRV